MGRAGHKVALNALTWVIRVESLTIKPAAVASAGAEGEGNLEATLTDVGVS